jgi:hypothetical protein
MLSEEALQEFKRIYKEEYNTDISEKDAAELAIGLLGYFNKVFRPIQRSWLQKVTQDNN